MASTRLYGAVNQRHIYELFETGYIRILIQRLIIMDRYVKLQVD
jgi:hypothetical protein